MAGIARPDAIDVTCFADCYQNGFELLAIISAGLLAALLAREWRYVPLATFIVGAPVFVIDFVHRATIFGGSIQGSIALYVHSTDFWFGTLGAYVLLLLFASAFFGTRRVVVRTLESRMNADLKAIAVGVELGVPAIGLYLLANHTRPDLFPLV
jgi:hypothetical protein